MHAARTCVLWLLLAASTLGVACQCTRGPVVEKSTVVAKAQSPAASAEIVYDFFQGRLKSYDSPVYNRDATTRESLTLFVTVSGAEKPKQLDIRKQSNKEDHAPLGSLEAELMVGPLGERVAYRLSDGDWELVFVTSGHWLLQAKSGALPGEAGPDDWTRVPTLRASIPSLLCAHEDATGVYEEFNRGRLLGHLEETLDEAEYVQILAELASLECALYRRWSFAAGQLPPKAKEALGAKLRAMVVRDPNVYLLKRAFSFLDLDDPAFAELIHTAPAKLAEDDEVRLWARHAMRGYLEASARLDAARAAETACALIDGGVEAKNLPDALASRCPAPAVNRVK